MHLELGTTTHSFFLGAASPVGLFAQSAAWSDRDGANAEQRIFKR